MSNWTFGPEYVRLFGDPGAPIGGKAGPVRRGPRPLSDSGRWSREYERCRNVVCTTPGKRHAGQGYCLGCYYRAKRDGLVTA